MMINKFMLIVMSILLVALSAACGNTATPSSSTQNSSPEEKQSANLPWVEGDTIKIGSFVPLSGGLALAGQDGRAGAEAYFQAVNDSGGINGKKIKLITEDDAYEPAKSIAAAKKLVERDQVMAIMGVIGSPTSKAALPYLQKQQVPFLFPWAGFHDFVFPPQPQLYSLLTTYHDQMVVASNYAVNELKPERIAMIYQNDEIGEEALKAVEEGLKPFGKQMVGSVGFERGTTDFSSEVLKLQQLNPDFVFMLAVPADAASIFKEAKKLNFHPKWLGHSSLADPTTIELGGDATEGIYAAQNLPLLDANIPGVKEYMDALKKYSPDRKPSLFGIHGYAAAKVIAEGLKRTNGDFTRENLIAALEDGKPYKTDILPDVIFSKENHAGNRSIMIVQVKNGKWETVTDWVSPKE